MSRSPLKNVADSVRQRLLNIARERGEVAEWVYRAYGRERLLYRLAHSEYVGRFVLKGATLFSIWTNEPYRPTRDIDLLGSGSNEVATLVKVFREVCKVAVPDDGVRFDPDSVAGEEIRPEDEYQGVRITLVGSLGQARIPIQIDIGYGDAVVPRPKVVEMPTILLDSLPPRMKAYPREAVVAEKFETIVRRGMGNGRMHDFYDVWSMARRFEFQGSTLAKSMAATFERRKTAMPEDAPVALTSEFAENKDVKSRWTGFLRRDNVRERTLPLGEVVELLKKFLTPPAQAVARGKTFDMHWASGGPWKRGQE